MTQQVQPQFTFEGGHLMMYHTEPTGLPQVKDGNVNDRDRMQDLLATEKYLSTAYNTALLEASHDCLSHVWQQNQDTCQKLQRQVFDTMFKKGWYKLPVADAQSVSHAYGQFDQYKVQLPFPSNIRPLGTSAAGMH
ncbi:MAG TPA: spore coat protein [Symbiobacteriaceae bacterium]